MFSNSYVHHGIGDDVDLENFLDLEGAIERKRHTKHIY